MRTAWAGQGLGLVRAVCSQGEQSAARRGMHTLHAHAALRTAPAAAEHWQLQQRPPPRLCRPRPLPPATAPLPPPTSPIAAARWMPRSSPLCCACTCWSSLATTRSRQVSGAAAAAVACMGAARLHLHAAAAASEQHLHAGCDAFAQPGARLHASPLMHTRRLHPPCGTPAAGLPKLSAWQAACEAHPAVAGSIVPPGGRPYKDELLESYKQYIERRRAAAAT